MIEQQAHVMAVDSGQAIIEVISKPGCSACHSNQSCGVSALGRLFGSAKTEFTIHNDHNLKQGDWIIVGLPEKAFLKAGFLLYLLPLLCMLVAAILVQSVTDNEILLVAAALAGLIGGLKYAAFRARVQHPDQYNVQFVRRELIAAK